MKRRDYDRDNEMAARIILADPERHAGLPLEWARLWMSRHGTERKQPVSASKILPPGRLLAGAKGGRQ